MRRRARVDRNHHDIVLALRMAGWFVLDMSRMGRGCPDLIAAKGGRVELIEVKDGEAPLSRRRLTRDEQRVSDALAVKGVLVQIVTKPEEAARL